MNVELAQQALADAKAYPDQFDMNSFFSTGRAIRKESDDFQAPPCGTTACFAGFVSLRVAPLGTKIVDGYIYEPGVKVGDKVHAEIYAAKALGITEAQGDVLFYVRDIGEVEKVLSYLADNPDSSEDSLIDAVRPA